MDGITTTNVAGGRRPADCDGSTSADFSRLSDPDPRVREEEVRRWVDRNFQWIMGLVGKTRRRWTALAEGEFTVGDVTARILQRLRNRPLWPIMPLGSTELEAHWRAYWRTVAIRLAGVRARRKSVAESRWTELDAVEGAHPTTFGCLAAPDSEAATAHRVQLEMEHVEAAAIKHLPVRQRLLFRHIVRAVQNGSETHREIARVIGVSHVTVGTVIAQARAAVLRDSAPSRRLDPGCRPN
jgi:DNA-directed RNA polymerase specialized sigma24 family protein